MQGRTMGLFRDTELSLDYTELPSSAERCVLKVKSRKLRGFQSLILEGKS